VYDADLASIARLLNVSVLSTVGPGNRIPLAGFVIAGHGLKRLLIRGVGPALAHFGLDGLLPAPTVRLFSGANLLADSSNWSSAANAGQIAAATAQVGAFPLRTDNADAALLVSLHPGAYTVQLTDATNSPGFALVEIFDVP
jgi:hypothetical protein